MKTRNEKRHADSVESEESEEKPSAEVVIIFD
jgi:hypothetical protein